MHLDGISPAASTRSKPCSLQHSAEGAARLLDDLAMRSIFAPPNITEEWKERVVWLVPAIEPDNALYLEVNNELVQAYKTISKIDLQVGLYVLRQQK
jgi:hypothetical protein